MAVQMSSNQFLIQSAADVSHHAVQNAEARAIRRRCTARSPYNGQQQSCLEAVQRRRIARASAF